MCFKCGYFVVHQLYFNTVVFKRVTDYCKDNSDCGFIPYVEVNIKHDMKQKATIAQRKGKE
jgi:hypothetical protein